jgi:hypothetical protein
MPSIYSQKSDPLGMGPHLMTYREQIVPENIVPWQSDNVTKKVGIHSLKIKSRDDLDNNNYEILFESLPVTNIMYGWAEDDYTFYVLYIVIHNTDFGYNYQALVSRLETKTRAFHSSIENRFRICMEFNIDPKSINEETMDHKMQLICKPFCFPDNINSKQILNKLRNKS